MKSQKRYLVIAGASKCGTTSIHHWLRSHEQLFFPKMKEVHFFSYPNLTQRKGGPGDRAIVSTLCDTFKKFELLFLNANKEVCIDNSPSYFFFSEDSSKRIEQALPNSKVLIILRNPVDKIYSQYMHLVRDGREELDFETALKREGERESAGYSDMWLYKKSGFYFARVKDFLDTFGKDRVKVMFFEDMKRDPHSFIENLVNFIEVSNDFNLQNTKAYNISGLPKSKYVSKYLLNGPLYVFAKKFIPAAIGGHIRRFFQKVNTGEKVTMRQETKEALIEEFLPDIKLLEKLINLKPGTLIKKFGWNE